MGRKGGGVRGGEGEKRGGEGGEGKGGKGMGRDRPPRIPARFTPLDTAIFTVEGE